ncbi:MAG: DUF4260 domain-containing protein [Flavobacteriales bacterium]
MKNLLKLEELAQFLVCLLALVMNDVPWWAYLLLALGPDIGMLGYLINARTGAFSYNLLHHKGVAVLIAACGFGSEFLNMLAGTSNLASTLLLAAIILYGHSSMDRFFGYGLKFGDHFQHTHLGWIGKPKGEEQGR